MRIKKLLAMLLAAAMALTLFAGCCSPSLLRLLLELLQDQYQNITVTAEDDLDATLRQAVSENDTFEDITAALAQALDKTVEFESLRSARAGDQTFSLVYRTGTDTQAIARQTYTDWNKILGSLPAGGRYLADLAVRKSGGGYYILVNVTVQKGSSSGGSGSHDGGSGGDDENGGGGQTQPDYEHTDYGYLVYTSAGLNKVLFDEQGDDVLNQDRANDFNGKTIKLKARDDYQINKTFEGDFEGVLTSENDKATINISGSAMFMLIGNNDIDDPDVGKVSNVDFCVTGEINGIETSGTYGLTAFQTGVVAYANNGAIENCNVTFKNEGKIVANSNSIGLMVSIGGIVGVNNGAIEKCSVTDGVIEVHDVNSKSAHICVGGIAGHDASGANGNPSEITGSTVKKIRFNINTNGTVHAHDIAGYWNNNDGKPTGDCSDNEFTVNGSPYVPEE